ncbi:MAG: hypothetical protein IPM39_27775 [Chloroflexi bacterium]|nr:hypothetical protein [Chloroflexota bacterium]
MHAASASRGAVVAASVDAIEAHEADASLIAIVARVIREQYQVEGKRHHAAGQAAAISGDSLQSPHDPEATYRHKHEQGYKGYVSSARRVTRTNAVQLITSVQTAPNCG